MCPQRIEITKVGSGNKPSLTVIRDAIEMYAVDNGLGDDLQHGVNKNQTTRLSAVYPRYRFTRAPEAGTFR